MIVVYVQPHLPHASDEQREQLVSFMDYLREKIQPNELIIVDAHDKETAKKVVSKASVLMGFAIGLEVMQCAEHLKLLQVPFVGVDKEPIDYLKKKGIVLCNSKWNSFIVAEFALASMLTVAKKIVEIDYAFRKGDWSKRFNSSVTLRGKNVLFLGFGSIIKELASLLTSFKVQMTAIRRHKKDEVENGVKIVTWENFDEVANKADFVVNILPLTPQTRGILTKKHFSAMKKGCIFVNIGRAQTVIEEDLYESLLNKHLGGAALDVWWNYIAGDIQRTTFPSTFPFHELPHVVMSPHRASGFADSLQTGGEVFWEIPIFNIKALEHNLDEKNRDNQIQYKSVIDYELGY